MAQVALLGAVIVIMAFTPLGYLKIGPVSITFLTIPVAIGAILSGPVSGAVLGFIFGLTSFAQCFGMDAFGTALLAINPVLTAIMCIIPRTLMGYITGACYRGLSRTKLKNYLTYAISAFLASMLNTVLFVSALILFFRNAEPVKALGDNVAKIIGILITTNSLVEALAATVLVTVIVKSVAAAVKRRSR